MKENPLNKRYSRAKKVLGIRNEEVARIFGLSLRSFNSSSARDRYREAFCLIVERTLDKTKFHEEHRLSPGAKV